MSKFLSACWLNSLTTTDLQPNHWIFKISSIISVNPLFSWRLILSYIHQLTFFCILSVCLMIVLHLCSVLCDINPLIVWSWKVIRIYMLKSRFKCFNACAICIISSNPNKCHWRQRQVKRIRWTHVLCHCYAEYMI